jgi:hypothetical protein
VKGLACCVRVGKRDRCAALARFRFVGVYVCVGV